MDFDLRATARRAMAENGFIPDFPPEVHREVEALEEATPGGVRDLRSLLWSSIDNRESRDLDQIEVAERLPYDHIRLFIAISDVDELVDKGSATDGHAGHSTTSVYAGPFVFPMLPERLSTDLTSLNPGEDRGAIVVEMDIGPGGAVVRHDVCRALVHSRAKLAYDAVGSWLEGGTTVPPGDRGGAGSRRPGPPAGRGRPAPARPAAPPRPPRPGDDRGAARGRGRQGDRPRRCRRTTGRATSSRTS